MALGSTLPLTEMSTRNLSGGKDGPRVRLINSQPSVNRLSRENVGASTSDKHMGLHSLLQGQLYLFSFFSFYLVRNILMCLRTSFFLGQNVFLSILISLVTYALSSKKETMLHTLTNLWVKLFCRLVSCASAFWNEYYNLLGTRCTQSAEALRYKPEGRWFDSR
jgi:hypothetical protein